MTQKSNRGGLRNPPGGRPPKADKKILVTFKLPPALVDRLRQEPNRTELIEKLLTQYFERTDQ
jgi:hypothetical protein